jgi:hypothetical protein
MGSVKDYCVHMFAACGKASREGKLQSGTGENCGLSRRDLFVFSLQLLVQGITKLIVAAAGFLELGL